MPIPTSQDELALLFKALGAPDPEQWARSQVTEGIPQLLRFLFLKQAWSSVLSEDSVRWIDNEIRDADAHPDRPYAGLGLALARCRALGVSPADLNAMARCFQAQMLFAVAYLLDGPLPDNELLEDVSWGLFQTDESGRPIGPKVCGLHESVLELDPTGQEMRPRHEN